MVWFANDVPQLAMPSPIQIPVQPSPKGDDTLAEDVDGPFCLVPSRRLRISSLLRTQGLLRTGEYVFSMY